MEDKLYLRDKTRDDVEELIDRNKGLIYHMLGLMRLRDDQDCESVSFEALWDAIETFDIYGAVPFSSYACKCIKNACNDVLRNRQALKRSLFVSVELTDNINVFYTDEVCTVDTFAKITVLFDTYLKKHVSGTLARNILLVWQASQFEKSPVEVANICGTTASYVGRVQCAFRAFIGNQLEE